MTEHEELADFLDDCAAAHFAHGRPQFARAAALLREARPQPGWRPISTAPTDGTEILASDYDVTDIVSWVEHQPWEGWSNREGQIMHPAWWQPMLDHPPTPTEPTTTETTNG